MVQLTCCDIGLAYLQKNVTPVPGEYFLNQLASHTTPAEGWVYGNIQDLQLIRRGAPRDGKTGCVSANGRDQAYMR